MAIINTDNHLLDLHSHKSERSVRSPISDGMDPVKEFSSRTRIDMDHDETIYVTTIRHKVERRSIDTQVVFAARSDTQ